jgi:hypothetical protein
VTTNFTIQVQDTAGQTATDGTTSVVATAVVPPTIADTVPNQAVKDNVTIDPFASVQITDTNGGQQKETVTITFNAANGTLTDPHAGTDNFTPGVSGTNSVYTLTDTAAQINTDLDALVFTPTPHQVAPGDTVTTNFTIQVQDTAGQTATDGTTSVVATAVAPPTVAPDHADVNVGATVTTDALHGVLANDGPAPLATH